MTKPAALRPPLTTRDGAEVAVRVRHSEGGGAYGSFRTTHDVSAFTSASVFQPGARVETLVRFSSTLGYRTSPDAWRDIRGFAVRFLTDDGPYDLVGNNSPVFFLNDDRLFSQLVVAQKLHPGSGRQGVFDLDRLWTFWLRHPETAHQVTWLLGDRGIPRSWRHQHGYGTHTFLWVNARGERFWVKYHFRSEQGTAHLRQADVDALDEAEVDYYARDLRTAIAHGDHPRWRLHVQVMPEAEAAGYRFNPFDITKVWPTSDYPLIAVGILELDRNPDDVVAEVEQAAFSPANLPPGIGPSPDRMLQARITGYPTFHRNRVTSPAPDALAPRGHPVRVFDGDELAAAAQPHREDDDFSQAGALVREVLDAPARSRLVKTVADHVAPIHDPDLRERVVQYWRRIDPAVADRVDDNVRSRVEVSG